VRGRREWVHCQARTRVGEGAKKTGKELRVRVFFLVRRFDRRRERNSGRGGGEKRVSLPWTRTKIESLEEFEVGPSWGLTEEGSRGGG